MDRLFRLFSKDDLLARGEAMRRLHSAWLTRALRRGSKTTRIPTRLVSQGGFAQLMRTPEGRAWVEQFWQEVLGDGNHRERSASN